MYVRRDHARRRMVELGMSAAALARACGLPANRLKAWLGGRPLPQEAAEHVRAYLATGEPQPAVDPAIWQAPGPRPACCGGDRWWEGRRAPSVDLDVPLDPPVAVGFWRLLGFCRRGDGWVAVVDAGDRLRRVRARELQEYAPQVRQAVLRVARAQGLEASA